MWFYWLIRNQVFSGNLSTQTRLFITFYHIFQPQKSVESRLYAWLGTMLGLLGSTTRIYYVAYAKYIPGKCWNFNFHCSLFFLASQKCHSFYICKQSKMLSSFSIKHELKRAFPQHNHCVTRLL